MQHLLGDDASITFTRDALLLTSELVTNAMRHTDGGCQLAASYDRAQQRLRVEVDDSSTELPSIPAGLPRTHLGGKGLHLVSEIAARWGAISHATGKTMWFELDAH